MDEDVLAAETARAKVARVEGQSMAPTLADQDRLIVNKLTYRIGEPRRGDDGRPTVTVAGHALEMHELARRFVDLGRVQTADVVCLEDRTIDAHSLL